ncbi:reverse transcriptase domain-containing protein [Tanacetum coccineum]
MEAQYGKFLDMIRAVRINIPLVEVLAGMPNYGKFLKELISNKHKIEQIFAAFLSDESSAMIQNKVPPKLRDPGSFLIPCNFNKTFSCNALADLGASINLMPYSVYAKLSLKTLKSTKMSVRLADRSFQYPVGIAENMLVEVGKFTFPADFVILKMEKDSKVPLILGRPFLHTADAVIRVKQKQLNLGVGTERMIFNIDSTMKHSYLNDHIVLVSMYTSKIDIVWLSWPSLIQWGLLDIVGPYGGPKGKVKFLIIAVDYFTKWVEANPIANVTGKHVEIFMLEHIGFAAALAVLITEVSQRRQQIEMNRISQITYRRACLMLALEGFPSRLEYFLASTLCSG